MPNVTVTNANSKAIPILGLGRVAPGATRSGYIEEAQYVPYATAYRTKGYRVGLLIKEQGGAQPDATQEASTTATLGAGVRVAVLDSTAGTFVFTLVAASSVPSGTRVTFLNKALVNAATLTAAGADNIGDASGTTESLTAGERQVLVSDGVSRWTYSS